MSKYIEKIKLVEPTYVAFENLEDIDYPEMFSRMPSEKRTQDELTQFTELCENLKTRLMTANRESPQILFAVEKDTKVWFFELGGGRGIGSPIELVRPLLNLFNPNLFVVIAESWMKKVSKDEQKKYNYGDITKDPEKVEALILDGRTRDGKRYSKFFEIKRSQNNVELIDLCIENGEATEMKTRYDTEPEK